MKNRQTTEQHEHGGVTEQFSRTRKAGRLGAKALASVFAGGIAAAGVTSLWPTHLQVGPVDATVSFSDFGFGGGLELDSSLGSVVFPDSHKGPGLRADLALGDGIISTIARPDGFRTAESSIVGDIREQAPAALLQLEAKALLGFTAGAGLVLLPDWRRRERAPGPRYKRALALGSIGIVGAAYSAALPAATYDPQFTANVRYTGLIAEAQGYFTDYGRLDTLNRSIAGPVSNFMNLVDALQRTDSSETVDPELCLLVAADAHGGGYELLRQMYQRDQGTEDCVRASLISGDFDDWGLPLETNRASHTGMDSLVSLMRTFAVQGNHDSDATIQDLRNRGAEILDGMVLADFEGLRLFGFPDANFSPDGSGSDKEAYNERAVSNAEDYAATDRGPIDILVVHDPLAAKAFIDAYPDTVRLAVVGHTHESILETYNNTVMINPGALTGAQLRILDNGTPQPLGAAEIRYTRTEDGVLVPYSVTQLDYDVFDPNQRSVETNPIRLPESDEPSP